MTLPIMCELTAEAIKARRAGLLPGLASTATERVATADGYRLTFEASTENVQQIATVIDAERKCCRWLRFDLQVSPDAGPITLTLSGPEGAVLFLAALFDA